MHERGLSEDCARNAGHEYQQKVTWCLSYSPRISDRASPTSAAHSAARHVSATHPVFHAGRFYSSSSSDVVLRRDCLLP